MNIISKLQKKMADRQQQQRSRELLGRARELFDVTVDDGKYFVVINGLRVSVDMFDDEPCHVVENMRYNYVTSHKKLRR